MFILLSKFDGPWVLTNFDSFDSAHLIFYGPSVLKKISVRNTFSLPMVKYDHFLVSAACTSTSCDTENEKLLFSHGPSVLRENS